jgi:signal transduction histidine kinase
MELQSNSLSDASSRSNMEREELESARDQIRVEQRRLAQVLEFASDPCLVTDDAGVIQQANSAVATLLHVPAGHLAGVPLVQFITPETRVGFPSNLAHSVPGPIVRIFKSQVKPDGGDPFPCSLKVTPLASAASGYPVYLWSLHVPGRGAAAALTPAPGEEQAFQALDEITTELASKPNRRSRLKVIADRIKILFQATSVVIYLYDADHSELVLEIAKGLPTIPGTHVHVGEGVIGMVAQDRQPMLVEHCQEWPFLEPQAEEQLLSAALAPMLCFDDLVGVMAIAQTDPSARTYQWDDVRLLSVLASMAALMIHAVRSLDKAKQARAEHKRAERELKTSLNRVQALSARIEVIREEERKQLAREIHDELGQQLTGFKLDLGWLAKNQQAILEKSQSLLKLSDSTIGTVQRISSELRPGVLDELGLVRALEWQAQDFQKRYGVECATDLSLPDEALDKGLSTVVFRIFQESLTNVARHAHATRISIELREERGHLLLQIEDNGCGIQESQVASPTSLGLVGMRERAQAFGGKVDVIGVPGLGTTVTVRFPLRRTPEAAT